MSSTQETIQEKIIVTISLITLAYIGSEFTYADHKALGEEQIDDHRRALRIGRFVSGSATVAVLVGLWALWKK